MPLYYSQTALLLSEDACTISYEPGTREDTDDDVPSIELARLAICAELIDKYKNFEPLKEWFVFPGSPQLNSIDTLTNVDEFSYSFRWIAAQGLSLGMNGNRFSGRNMQVGYLMDRGWIFISDKFKSRVNLNNDLVATPPLVLLALESDNFKSGDYFDNNGIVMGIDNVRRCIIARVIGNPPILVGFVDSNGNVVVLEPNHLHYISINDGFEIILFPHQILPKIANVVLTPSDFVDLRVDYLNSLMYDVNLKSFQSMAAAIRIGNKVADTSNT